MYLFIFQIFGNKKKVTTISNLRHFILPISIGIFNLLFINEQSSYNIKLLIISLFIIMLIYYNTNVFRFLQKQVWYNKKYINLNDDESHELISWTKLLFVFFLLCSLRIIISFIFDIQNNKFNYGTNYYFIPGILFFLFLMMTISNPKILFGFDTLYEVINVKRKLNDNWKLCKNNNISNQQDIVLEKVIYKILKQKIMEIDNIVHSKNLFRDHRMNQKKIAKLVNMPHSHINFIFKYHSKIKFTDYKNNHRILDAVRLIENNYLNGNTLESLAIEVGFSSYNPFYLAFLKQTTMSPKEYVININQRKELGVSK